MKCLLIIKHFKKTLGLKRFNKYANQAQEKAPNFLKRKFQEYQSRNEPESIKKRIAVNKLKSQEEYYKGQIRVNKQKGKGGGMLGGGSGGSYSRSRKTGRAHKYTGYRLQGPNEGYGSYAQGLPHHYQGMNDLFGIGGNNEGHPRPRKQTQQKKEYSGMDSLFS